MIRVRQLRLPVDHDDEGILKAVRKHLELPDLPREAIHVFQRSIDARKGKPVLFSYTVDIDDEKAESLLGRTEFAKQRQISARSDSTYCFLKGKVFRETGRRPVVVGTGPAGLFAGLLLSRMGLRPILLERGKKAGDRARDVTKFWRTGSGFEANSNVQFGEGGAGTFSDGKLYTQIGDEGHRCRWILECFVEHGAPPEILAHSRPHIGTDRLIGVLRRIRASITELGGEMRFGARVTELQHDQGQVRGLRLADGAELEADEVVLAVGHSARDVFEMLERKGIVLQAKPFSIGVRIEHPQRMIDQGQYGSWAGHARLGSAPYKFVHHASDGRGVYSFCMCPGGLVVASNSEEGGVVTNGMSSYSRDEANANSGFMVELKPGDYEAEPLAGIAFQRELEQRAFRVGGGVYRAPAQLLGDFMAGRPSRQFGEVMPSYRPGVELADLREVLPSFVVAALREAIPQIAKRLSGFNRPDAVLTAVETRSSSPIRIPRGGDFQSLSLAGLYPAGEGAGYAGGIISAAVDGLRVAEAIGLKHLK